MIRLVLEYVYGWSLPLTTITQFNWFCPIFLFAFLVLNGRCCVALLYHFLSAWNWLADWLRILIFHCSIHVFFFLSSSKRQPNGIDRETALSNGTQFQFLSFSQISVSWACMRCDASVDVVWQFDAFHIFHSFLDACLFCISLRFMPVIFPSSCIFLIALTTSIAYEMFDRLGWLDYFLLQPLVLPMPLTLPLLLMLLYRIAKENLWSVRNGAQKSVHRFKFDPKIDWNRVCHLTHLERLSLHIANALDSRFARLHLCDKSNELQHKFDWALHLFHRFDSAAAAPLHERQSIRFYFVCRNAAYFWRIYNDCLDFLWSHKRCGERWQLFIW